MDNSDVMILGPESVPDYDFLTFFEKMWFQFWFQFHPILNQLNMEPISAVEPIPMVEQIPLMEPILY